MASKVMDFWKDQEVEVLEFHVKNVNYEGESDGSSTIFKAPLQLLRLSGLKARLRKRHGNYQTLEMSGVHSGTIGAFLNWVYYGLLFPQSVKGLFPAATSETKSKTAEDNETPSFVVTSQIACAISVVNLGHHIGDIDLQNSAIESIWAQGRLPCDIVRLNHFLQERELPAEHNLYGLLKRIRIFHAYKSCLEELPDPMPHTDFSILNEALDGQLTYPSCVEDFLLDKEETASDDDEEDEDAE